MTRPNILFVMSDDHAAHAIGAYGSVVNATPQIDRIAAGGVRVDNAFCTNALCAPSRAAILTGTYNHVNGVTTLPTDLDNSQPTFVSALHDAGYATAIVGKWHLGHGPRHDPRGFDSWTVLPDQGEYHDPTFLDNGVERVIRGYVTDVTTDLALDWLDTVPAGQPFCLMVHHKAPHRPWEPDAAHAHLYDDVDIPVPDTFFDDYAGRAEAARTATMRVSRDLTATDLKQPVPAGLSAADEARWKYQRYLKDYLRCVASVDDNVGRLLDELDARGLTDDTIVVYTSDQGFFLGDHGWYDKRFMYEESLRMPLLVRYPREIAPGTATGTMVSNVDFAQTFLDYAGVPAPDRMQGRSLRGVLAGDTPPDWREVHYYRYWEHGSRPHHVRAHYGIRTPRYKLIFYYSDGLGLPGTSDERFAPEWELFDLTTDPRELHSVYDDPAYAGVRVELTELLATVQREVGDDPWQEPDGVG
ncbi:sulfatase family protein [Actinocatenispora rupis]|uniref:Sulfatase n=1 Tax=Actinocatenispora rupis TaxID=519421 RepID=A0A8J3ITG1_9ACTN|nr:sulfatase [Actinocatenispora rupis]GID09611.1 sulfatase [Actinocatenispora rupis]